MSRRIFVKVGSWWLAVVREGKGPPVILLHGIPTSSYLWRNVIPLLSDEFEVYAPYMLGYGESDKPPDADLSVAAQANYISQLMEAVGLKRAFIVGHDIGGGVAQLIAVRYPGKVMKLILVDTVAYDSWPIYEIARLKEPAWDQIMVNLDLHKGFKRGFLRGVTDQEWITDELIAAYVKPFEGLEGRRAYLRCSRALNNRDLLDAADEIERIEVPTLIIWGEADTYQPLRYGEMLKERMRNAQLIVIAGAGHFIQEDKPHELAAVMKEFLKS